MLWIHYLCRTMWPSGRRWLSLNIRGCFCCSGRRSKCIWRPWSEKPRRFVNNSSRVCSEWLSTEKVWKKCTESWPRCATSWTWSCSRWERRGHPQREKHSSGRAAVTLKCYLSRQMVTKSAKFCDQGKVNFLGINLAIHPPKSLSLSAVHTLRALRCFLSSREDIEKWYQF